jgi:hypothetical protein
MTKVRCTLGELMAVVETYDLEGEWSENTKNKFHTFHAETGEVLNWWPSTGTVQFQGRCPEKFRKRFCREQINLRDRRLSSNLPQRLLAKFALDVHMNLCFWHWPPIPGPCRTSAFPTGRKQSHQSYLPACGLTQDLRHTANARRSEHRPDLVALKPADGSSMPGIVGRHYTFVRPFSFISSPENGAFFF